jgi:hypothetical protein
MINSKYSWSAENRVEIMNNLKTITNELRISYELKMEPNDRSFGKGYQLRINE